MNISSKSKKAIVRACYYYQTQTNATLKDVFIANLLSAKELINNGAFVQSSSSNGNSVSFQTSIDTSPEELLELYSELLEMLDLILEKGGSNQSQDLIKKKLCLMIDASTIKGIIGYSHI